jgi:hypothetical protein
MRFIVGTLSPPSGTPVIGPARVIDGQVVIDVQVEGGTVASFIGRDTPIEPMRLADTGALLIDFETWYDRPPGFDEAGSLQLPHVPGSLRVEHEAGEFVLVCDTVETPADAAIGFDPSRLCVKKQVAVGSVTGLIYGDGVDDYAIIRQRFDDDIQKDQLAGFAAATIEGELVRSMTNTKNQKPDRVTTPAVGLVTKADLVADRAAWLPLHGGSVKGWAAAAMRKFNIKDIRTLNNKLNKKE